MYKGAIQKIEGIFSFFFFTEEGPIIYTRVIQKIKGTFLSDEVGWLVGFHAVSTFVGYLTPNPFLCK